MPAMNTTTTTVLLQATSITTALLAAGGIATLSLFDVPILQAQPASRSLPSTRWLFSRGSHLFPAAAFLSAAGFATLAATLARSRTSGGYLAATACCISIAPWTSLVMLGNNFALIQLNLDKVGSRSSKGAEEVRLLAADEKNGSSRKRTAEDSVGGKGEASQWTDLSGPQERTPVDTTADEDERVRDMLGVFARQNMVRAGLMAAGGVIGLVTALM